MGIWGFVWYIGGMCVMGAIELYARVDVTRVPTSVLRASCTLVVYNAYPSHFITVSVIT